LPHGEPGDRKCQDSSYKDQPHKINRYQGKDIPDIGTQDLAYPDFGSAAGDLQRGQSQQSKAGNEQGEDGSDVHHGLCSLFIPVLTGKGGIQKGIVKFLGGVHPLPGIPKKGNIPHRIRSLHAHCYPGLAYILGFNIVYLPQYRIGIHCQHQGTNGLDQRLKMKVLHNPENRNTKSVKWFSNRVCQPKFPDKCFIDQSSVLFIAGFKIAAGF